MPRLPAAPRPYADADDELMVHTVIAWQEAALYAFYDIEAFRDVADRRDWDHDHAQPPSLNFFLHTNLIVGRITARHPHLKPKPVQDVYAAVSAWYRDRSASGLPPQGELSGMLDQAVMTVQAVKRAIDAKAAMNAAAPELGDGGTNSPGQHGEEWLILQRAAELYLREMPDDHPDRDEEAKLNRVKLKLRRAALTHKKIRYEYRMLRPGQKKPNLMLSRASVADFILMEKEGTPQEDEP